MLGGHHGPGEPGALGVVHEAGYLGRVGLRAGAARLERHDERRKWSLREAQPKPGAIPSWCPVAS